MYMHTYIYVYIYIYIYVSLCIYIYIYARAASVRCQLIIGGMAFATCWRAAWGPVSGQPVKMRGQHRSRRGSAKEMLQYTLWEDLKNGIRDGITPRVAHQQSLSTPGLPTIW